MDGFAATRLRAVTHHAHDLTDRLARAQKAAAEAGMEALLISPGADLRYLTGYEALPLERLTCLVLPAVGDPVMVVPALEQPAAEASALGGLGMEILPWHETEDPYALVATRLPRTARTVGLDNHMWAEKVLNFRRVLPGAEQALAGEVLSALRMRKTAAEVESLKAAGEAIDHVHARVPEWLRPGRTEREVGRDIGGTMPDGYCSDSTRNFSLGAPSGEYAEYFAVLLAAQKEQCDFVEPGVTAEELDAVGRDIITKAGYGDRFIHRTGHGIGLETHEEPYIVAGSQRRLEPGMAFSIEPGIYLAGRHGARIGRAGSRARCSGRSARPGCSGCRTRRSSAAAASRTRSTSRSSRSWRGTG
jgi:Xaa-Pro aminopeptidase